jgi:hypothetical protein
MQPESMADALKRLSALGFRHSLRAKDGKLCDRATGVAHAPETLTIAETLRFEGESDPDEQAILFAVRGPDGLPFGIYSSAFGPAMAAEDVAVVRRLGAKAV